MEITEATYRPKFTLQEGARLYRELHNQVRAAQLFKRSYLFYAGHALCVFIAMTTTGYLLVITTNPILFGGLAMLLAICLTQLGGYMHDAGHMMILKSRAVNDVAGTFCASLLCMNYNAWKSKHNAHHAHPNQEGHDPDVDIPIFSFTRTRYLSKTGVTRLLRRYQAYLYFPLTFLLAYSLQFKNSVEYFIRAVSRNGVRPSIVGEMSLHAAGFFLW